MRSFEIRRDGAEQHAAAAGIAVSLLGDGEGRLFKRNAIKQACTPQARKVQWLVAELDGVFTYIHAEAGTVSVVVSRRELYP